MKRSLYFSALYGAFLSLQLFPALSQADQQPAALPEKEKHLEQIIVTATRTEKDLDAAPGSVSVVTKNDIEKMNVVTFDDALKATPGVVLSRGKGMMDQMSSITLRGLPGQNRTLIMVDGVTMNSPYSGSILSGSIAPGSLDRIEVVKGASSSLYGGYAMAGAINMITAMPKKREFTLQAGFGSALEGAGAENTRRVAASYGDVFKDKFRIYINNDYVGTDGYVSDYVTGTPATGSNGAIPTVSSTGGSTFLLGNKGMNGAWQNNLTVKAEYQFSSSTKARFTFLKSYGEYSYSDPQTYMKNGSGTPVWSNSGSEYAFLGSYGANDQYLYSLALETEVASAKLKMNIGFMDQAASWYSTASSTTTAPVATRAGGPGKLSSSPASAWSADLQATFPVQSWNLVTIGGAYRETRLNATEYLLSNWLDEGSKGQIVGGAKGSDRTLALFAQDEISIRDDLTAYVGFRQDWWETFDGYTLVSNSAGVVLPGYPKNVDSRSADSFSPKAAIVYKPFEQTTFKMSGGKSFRAPTNYELYRTWTIGSNTYRNNPDLKPETNLSWDASVSQGLWPGAILKATYFENYISDMIYSSTTGTVRDKFNAGKGESKGVEVEAEQRFGKLTRLFANYTYADARIKENSADTATVGKRMTDTPEHMFNVGSDVEYGPFGATFTGRYVGKRFANDKNNDTARNVQGTYDQYFVADIKMRYKLTAWATASFSVNNLLDEQYFSSSRAPGRSCYGDLTFKF